MLFSVVFELLCKNSVGLFFYRFKLSGLFCLSGCLFASCLTCLKFFLVVLGGFLFFRLF